MISNPVLSVFLLRQPLSKTTLVRRRAEFKCSDMLVKRDTREASTVHYVKSQEQSMGYVLWRNEVGHFQGRQERELLHILTQQKGECSRNYVSAYSGHSHPAQVTCPDCMSMSARHLQVGTKERGLPIDSCWMTQTDFQLSHAQFFLRQSLSKTIHLFILHF